MYQKRLRDAENVYFRYAPPQAFRNHSSLEKVPNPPFQGAAAWQCSVYYYWFLFMRELQLQPKLNKPEQIGLATAPSPQIRTLFGDVTDIGFLEWWIVRGRNLFCEPTYEGVKALEDHEVEHGVTLAPGKRSRILDDPHIYLKIPVHQDFDKSIEEVRSFLKQAKREQQLSSRSASDNTAILPVFTKPVLTALEKAYQAWRLRNTEPDMALAEIAVKAGLAARPDNKDTANRSANASAASRALKQASLLVEWVGKGVFPVTSQSQIPKAHEFAEAISTKLSKPNLRHVRPALLQGKATEDDLRQQALEHGLDLSAIR